MRRLTMALALAPVLVSGCASRTDPVTQGTLAELRDVRVDEEEAKVEQGLDQAMQIGRAHV